MLRQVTYLLLSIQMLLLILCLASIPSLLLILLCWYLHAATRGTALKS